MASEFSPLPDFERPPVVEVALGVQFDKLTGLHAAHFGLLWERYRERFPHTEERAPLDPVIEQFGTRTARRGLRLTVEEGLPLPRVAFLNEFKTELLQVQVDRFIRNWRKVGEGATYPRYERIRERFESDFAMFQSFLREHGLQPTPISQCEAAYVNRIEAVGWERHGELASVTEVFGEKAISQFLGEPEDAHLVVRYPIRLGEKVVGRLYVNVQPRYSPDNDAPYIFMELVARGAPLGTGLTGAIEFLNLGREWIVKGFADLTSKQMHRIWRRRV